MVDRFKKFIYQIEINTIASSMGFFSDGVKKFFTYFSKKYPQYYERYLNADSDNTLPLHKENVIENISHSMYQAIKLFSPDNFTNTLIIFVIQENEKNEFDQRVIENQLWEK
jgi:hypothetical protein